MKLFRIENYHLSRFGKNLLENVGVSFAHDLTSYDKSIRENISGIDDLTLFCTISGASSWDLRLTITRYALATEPFLPMP